MLGGVYQITNHTNGKRYIGSSAHVKGRWRTHLSLLRRREHPNAHLQAAFDKYGQGAFGFSLLEDIEDTLQLVTREQHYLDTLNPEYNIAQMAGSTLGCCPSDEIKRKLSEAHKGQPGFWYGKHLSDEIKQKISEAHKGKHLSKEHRAKISAATTGLYRSAEHRRKLSEVLKGRRPSEEARLNMSKAQQARQHRERVAKAQAITGGEPGRCCEVEQR